MQAAYYRAGTDMKEMQRGRVELLVVGLLAAVIFVLALPVLAQPQRAPAASVTSDALR